MRLGLAVPDYYSNAVARSLLAVTDVPSLFPVILQQRLWRRTFGDF